jgi:hypothetical protein
MRLYLIVMFCLFCLSGTLLAQDDDDPTSLPLTVSDVEILTQPDIFGMPSMVAQGRLLNESTQDAYTNLSLYAEVYDAADELIGEGFGFLVNACGVGVLPDFALQPGESQTISVTLELYEEDTEDEIERVEIIAGGSPVDPSSANPFLTYRDVTSITDREVVMVEWIDSVSLRYAVGCDANNFTMWDWYELDLTSGDSTPIEHPRAGDVTEATLERLSLDEGSEFELSYLSFHPGSRRLIFQNELNTLLTAEPDGTFPRLLYDNMARFSLHGFIWLPDERFLAYYYGAYGDPVRYVTGSMLGQQISGTIYQITPSVTVPGPAPDGARVVISQEVDGQGGYYLWSAISPGGRLLFEADLPGNNWPAPIFLPTTGGEAFIYFIRPVNGQARLQCYDTASSTLNDLLILPLNLGTDDRAWSFLGPENPTPEEGGFLRTLAIAANGVNGGLWTVELTGCGRS